MENYVVLARKYRPSRFEEVVGQAHITTTLKNAIKNNHLAQSFLFCGPRGVGKTTCARILAKTINCTNLTADIEACNECESCVSFNRSASFNIHELDAASNNGVDDVRSLVEQVRFAPQAGKYKIYIIDEVHMMSSSAFNAFLKTLEEPPPYAIFILATTEKHKIIPTILSRCQIFDFKRIKIDDTVDYLEEVCKREDIKAERDALHLIAQKTDGAMRDALTIFDKIISFTEGNINYKNVVENLNILDYDYFFKITDALLAQDAAEVLLIFNDVWDKGFEGDTILNGLAEHFRNLLICKEPATLMLLEASENLKIRYKEQAEITPSSLLLTGLNVINECEINYKASKNRRLHIELCLIKLSYIGAAIKISGEKKTEIIPVAINIKKKDISEKTSIHVKEPEPPKISTSSQNITETKKPEPLRNEEKPKEAAATSNPIGSFKLPSLDEVKQLVKKEEGINKAADTQTKSGSGDNNLEIDNSDLQKAWIACAETFTSNIQAALQALMKDILPEFKEGKVTAIVNSKVQFDVLEEGKHLIIEFLRKELNEPGLNISLEIDKNKQPSKEARPYTPKDKFQKMAEKNPLLQELKDRLDLELEF